MSKHDVVTGSTQREQRTEPQQPETHAENFVKFRRPIPEICSEQTDRQTDMLITMLRSLYLGDRALVKARIPRRRHRHRLRLVRHAYTFLRPTRAIS